MNNVIAIRRRQLNAPTIYLTNPRDNFDWIFVIGVVLTVVVPQVILGIYFGPVAAVVLGGCTTLGSGIGLNNYHHRRFSAASRDILSGGRKAEKPDEQVRLAA